MVTPKTKLTAKITIPIIHKTIRIANRFFPFICCDIQTFTPHFLLIDRRSKNICSIILSCKQLYVNSSRKDLFIAKRNGMTKAIPFPLDSSYYELLLTFDFNVTFLFYCFCFFLRKRQFQNTIFIFCFNIFLSKLLAYIETS